MCLGICRVIGIFGRFYCGVVSHLLVKIRSRNYFTKQLIASPGLPPLSGQCKYREIGIGTIAGRPEIDPILEHALADRFDTGEIALLQPHDGARQRPATAPRVCSEQPWDYPPASRSSRLARVLLDTTRSARAGAAGATRVERPESRAGRRHAQSRSGGSKAAR
jgi:hypothetical protein